MVLVIAIITLAAGIGIGIWIGITQTRARLSTTHAQEVLELNRKLASQESNATHLETRLKEQRDYLEEVRRQTRIEFENLAQKILDSKAKVFSQQTETSLEGLLKPLKERLATFELKVETSYNTEAKERFALKSEV